MSRIGRKPLEIPKGVQVSITKDAVSVKGPKGTLNMKRQGTTAAVDIKQAKDEGADVLVFERKGNLDSLVLSELSYDQEIFEQKVLDNPKDAQAFKEKIKNAQRPHLDKSVRGKSSKEQ